MDKILEKLRAANPGLEILSVMDPEFATYGTVHSHIQVPEMKKFVYEQMEMPESEYYIPCCEDLMKMEDALHFTQFAYGETACQVGYYSGFGTKLNALEYHKCSEMLVEFEPCVAIIGHIWDIREDRLDSSVLKLFYIPQDTCVELFATTLHFAPCMATKAGVRQVVCQTATTNTPLHHPERLNKTGENKFLYERNKWVLAHPEAAEALPGAAIAIDGVNVSLTPVED